MYKAGSHRTSAQKVKIPIVFVAYWSLTAFLTEIITLKLTVLENGTIQLVCVVDHEGRGVWCVTTARQSAAMDSPVTHSVAESG